AIEVINEREEKAAFGGETTKALNEVEEENA
ncbi:unnamed protein product, partial [marine sediment metagenome]